MCVCAFKENRSEQKRQEHKTHPTHTTAFGGGDENTRIVSLKGRLTNESFSSAEGQQKRGCRSWISKDGKNLDSKREWGGEGVSGRGVAGAEVKRSGRARSPRGQ